MAPIWIFKSLYLMNQMANTFDTSDNNLILKYQRLQSSDFIDIGIQIFEFTLKTLFL